MQEQPYINRMRHAKFIQLICLLIIELTFIIFLILNKELRARIYSNETLFILCFITWILALFSLGWLIYDFYKLRTIATESHVLNQAAYLDKLTGVPNRHSLDTVFQTYTTPESLQHTCCVMLTISNLKELNANHGRQSGDKILQDFCNIFEEVGDAFGFVGRNGGNEFVAVLNNCNHETAKRFLAILANRIALYDEIHPDTPIRTHSAYTLYDESNVTAFTQLLTVTYNKLHDVTS